MEGVHALLSGADVSGLEREGAVAIVDPYTSGRFLVEELRRRGWPLVAIRSSLSIDAALLGTWNPAPFEHIVVHHGDVAETVEALSVAKPLRAVIAGSEPGVELAEALAAALGLRGNDPERPRPRCRWDKYDMHEQLLASGLRACRQRLCTGAAEAVAFAAELGAGALPVVAKPRHSHGGACVYLCKDSAALEEAVAAIFASKDSAGRANDVALVQEFLEGTEYVVDCVSCDGQHFVSAAWIRSKTRTGAGVAYDMTQALRYDTVDGSLLQRLYSYVHDCLTVLGVQHGASHSEVVISKASPAEFCLIKVGARMHGAMYPALWSKCAGRSQAQPFLLADLFTEDGHVLGQKLVEVRKGAPAYKLDKVAMQVDLQCPKGGVLSESIEASSGAWLRALRTFSTMRLFVEDGDRILPTQDLFTSPGFVLLVGPEEEVEHDWKAIREREQSGQMYSLREAPNGSTGSGSGFAFLRHSNNPSARLRELEAEAEKLISPIASRAASPLLSPQQAPALPPGFEDDLVEFTLDGAEGLDDGFSLECAPGEFSLDGPGLDALAEPPLPLGSNGGPSLGGPSLLNGKPRGLL